MRHIPQSLEPRVNSNLSPFSSACLKANEEIVELFAKIPNEKLAIKREVGAGGDISTEADMIAEQVFVKYLGSFGEIESEESGTIGSGAKKIILDPLDGSSNFLSNIPYYGSSAALINADGKVESAFVCNMANGDFFQKNDILLKGKLGSAALSEVLPNPNSLVGIFERSYADSSMVSRLKEENLKFRSPGATALSLAYAHDVNFVLLSGGIRIYDVVAGLSLCEGLEVVVENEYVIVTKEKDIMSKLLKVVNRSL